MVGPSRASGIGTLLKCNYLELINRFEQKLKRVAIEHDELKREVQKILMDTDYITGQDQVLAYGIEDEEPEMYVNYKGIDGREIPVTKCKIDMLILLNERALIVEVKTSRTNMIVEANQVEQLRDYSILLATLISNRGKLKVVGDSLKLEMELTTSDLKHQRARINIISRVGDPYIFYDRIQNIKYVDGVLVKINKISENKKIYTIVSLNRIDINKDYNKIKDQFFDLVISYLSFKRAKWPYVVGPWCHVCKLKPGNVNSREGRVCPVFITGD